MAKAVDVEKHKQMYLDFVETRESAVLNFVDEDGKPFSSIVPFVKKDNKLYIYISEVADHYRLTEKSEFIDVMLRADESATKNPFATERVRFICTPEKLGNEGHEDLFALFDAAFNKNLMDMLRGLDFSLFELTPVTGRYVVGFGLAFDLTIDGETFNHVVVDKNKKAGKVK